jgi:hypothetical protein
MLRHHAPVEIVLPAGISSSIQNKRDSSGPSKSRKPKRSKGESARQTESMKTLKARVLRVLSFQPFRRGDKSDSQSKDTIIKFWRMRCSYPDPETFCEFELREPLKSFASEKYTLGLNGFVEFEMLSEPHVAAGDSIQIVRSHRK